LCLLSDDVSQPLSVYSQSKWRTTRKRQDTPMGLEDGEGVRNVTGTAFGLIFRLSWTESRDVFIVRKVRAEF
jgi:hypothetical protein